MDLGLVNKRVLIAGGSRGIGLAMARAFLMESARVALLARNADDLREATRVLGHEGGVGRVLACPADCADENAWPAVLRQIEVAWQGLDIAIANVGDGRGRQDALPDTTQFEMAWRTNFTTAEMTARATLPLLRESRGCLLFVSSIAGLEFIGAPTDYSVAKGAIVMLTKQMARRLAPGVRVNCIAPGNVRFPGGSWDVKAKDDPQRIATLIERTVPMKRFGTPQEIADAAMFLCSERAAFITGACLVVDGGQTTGLH